MWQAPLFRDATEPFPSPYQASLEPEHPTGPGVGQRQPEACSRVYFVHPRRQDHQASAQAEDHRSGLTATGAGETPASRGYLEGVLPPAVSERLAAQGELSGIGHALT